MSSKIVKSELNKLIVDKSNTHIWDTGLHDQVNNKPESGSKLFDKTLKSQVK